MLGESIELLRRYKGVPCSENGKVASTQQLIDWWNTFTEEANSRRNISFPSGTEQYKDEFLKHVDESRHPLLQHRILSSLVIQDIILAKIAELQPRPKGLYLMPGHAPFRLFYEDYENDDQGITRLERFGGIEWTFIDEKYGSEKDKQLLALCEEADVSVRLITMDITKPEETERLRQKYDVVAFLRSRAESYPLISQFRVSAEALKTNGLLLTSNEKGFYIAKHLPRTYSGVIMNAEMYFEDVFPFNMCLRKVGALPNELPDDFGRKIGF